MLKTDQQYIQEVVNNKVKEMEEAHNKMEKMYENKLVVFQNALEKSYENELNSMNNTVFTPYRIALRCVASRLENVSDRPFVYT